MRNVFLIGPMGAGKTTIGRQLSKELGMRFIDSDHVIEERTGADIAWIFDLEGEEGFRLRERNIIDELTQQQGVVLATGGGVITTPENCNVLGARGIVVYLETSLEEQFRRTEFDKKRPLLQTTDLMRRLKELHRHRVPLYEALADFTIETHAYNVRTIVNMIAEFVRQQ